MNLTVLNVAFPFAPVTADPVGGAEQVVSQIDRAVLQAGGRSVVIAAEGSALAGIHMLVHQPPGEIRPASRQIVHDEVRNLLEKALSSYSPDVIHFHGLDFAEYLPPTTVPAMVTLHLPLSWYPSTASEAFRSGVCAIPVSWDQVQRGLDTAPLVVPIENGVDLDAFHLSHKRRFALLLSRICPEKGIHLALDAARRAGMPLLIAGAVFPYPEHQQYLRREVLPRLDGERRWIGPVSGARKQRLISMARCLIVASTVEETSSLVAMEAAASGTPVVALRSGALATVVDHERTGLLVDRLEDLPDALHAAQRLSPHECRRVAEHRFSIRRTLSRYLAAYDRIAAGGSLPLARGGCML